MASVHAPAECLQPGLQPPCKKRKKVSDSERIPKALVKSAKEHRTGRSKSQGPRKHDDTHLKPSKEPRLHPLVAAVDDALNTSAATLFRDSNSALEQAHSNLISALADQSPTFEDQNDARDAIFVAFSAPLADEQLRFVSKDGASVGVVSLGERMEWWEKKIKASEQRLAKLWDEWRACQGEVLDLGSTMDRDGESDEQVENTNRVASTSARNQPTQRSNQKNLAEYFQKRITTICDNATKGLLASEKAMAAGFQRKSKEWLETVTLEL